MKLIIIFYFWNEKMVLLFVEHIATDQNEEVLPLFWEQIAKLKIMKAICPMTYIWIKLTWLLLLMLLLKMWIAGWLTIEPIENMENYFACWFFFENVNCLLKQWSQCMMTTSRICLLIEEIWNWDMFPMEHVVRKIFVAFEKMEWWYSNIETWHMMTWLTWRYVWLCVITT